MTIKSEEELNQLKADGWATTTGGSLYTDFVATIGETFWSYDANYQGGQALLLHWVLADVEYDDPDMTVPEDGLVVKIPCGSKWVPIDGGKVAQMPGKPENHGFNKSSLYGRLVDSVIGVTETWVGGEFHGETTKPDLTAVGEVLRTRGRPQDADIWTGLRFRFEDVSFDYGTDKEGVKIASRPRALPVAFLGAEGEEKPAAKPAAKKAAGGSAAAAKAKAAAAKAAAVEETPYASLGISEGLAAIVAPVIAECANDVEFITALASDDFDPGDYGKEYDHLISVYEELFAAVKG